MIATAPLPSRHPRLRAAVLWSVAAGALGLLFGSRSLAQPAPPAGSPAPSASASTSAAALESSDGVSGPAIARAVHLAARDIAQASSGAIVGGTAVESDVPAPRSAELLARVVSLVAGALGPEARTARSPGTLESVRAQAASAAVIVLVKVQVARGELRVSADVFPIARNVWDRARNPSPGPVAHGFGVARVDAEVRSYLAPVPLVASETTKVPLAEPETMALLCDDVDGDGALEIVAGSRRSVAVGRIRNKSFEVLRKAAWDSFSPIAAVPWRQPLMAIAASGGGMFDLGCTDRAKAIRLDGVLAMRASYGGFPVPLSDGAGCVQRDLGVLSGALSRCTPDAKTPAPWAEIPFPFDGAAAAGVVRADGTVVGVLAARRVSDTTVVLRDSQGRTASVPNAGAQLAVADLDLDGDPELIASKNVLNPAQDALVVKTWRWSGQVQERWTAPVPSGIAAIAVCPPEGPGMRAVAVATSSELWLVR